MNNLIGFTVLLGVLIGICLLPFIIIHFLKGMAQKNWNKLLEKYPPQIDISLSILEDVVEQFIVDGNIYGKGYQAASKWAILAGEKGIHLTPSINQDGGINVGMTEKYLFMPYNSITFDGSWILVNNSNDRIELIAGVVENLRSLSNSNIR